MKCIRVYLVPRSASTSVFVLFSPFHPRLYVLYPSLFPYFFLSFLFTFYYSLYMALNILVSARARGSVARASERTIEFGLLELCSGLENGCEWRFPPSMLMSANLLILQHEVFMAWP